MATATKDGYKYLDGNSKNIKGNMLKDKKKKSLLPEAFFILSFCLCKPIFCTTPDHTLIDDISQT